MSIDLTQRSELSARERHEISTLLHYALLEEIFRIADWRLGDAVFHGGTSLKVVWMSPRFSEDLDFMVREDQMGGLDDLVRRARDGLASRLMAELPKSTFGLKGERDPERRLARYAVRWSHPNRIGRVLIKLEFYEVPGPKLSQYGATMVTPDPDRETRIAIATPIVGPQLVSVIGDKLVALAKREYFKHRDVFDLWYAHTRAMEMGAALDIDGLAQVVEQVGRIYDYGAAEISDDLRKVASTVEFAADPEGRKAAATALAEDLSRWIPPALHEGYQMGGVYNAMLETSRRIVIDVAQALDEARLDFEAGPEMRP